MSYYAGNYNQGNPIRNLKSFFLNNNILTRLILINVAVWLIINIIKVFGFLMNIPGSEVSFNISDFLGVPASLSHLIIRPWTLITYMFTHIGFFHILFNMLWLFWFAQIFLQYLNSRQLLSVYLMGGISGAVLFVLFYNIFPVYSVSLMLATTVGASASVMAIVTAISFYVPNFSINLLLIGRIKIIYIAVALFVMDFFQIDSSNSGGHIAHIGGALYGLWFVYSLKKGKDMSRFFASLSFERFRKFFMKKKKSPFTNVYTNTRPMKDEDYNVQKHKQQDKVDKILDKISKSGYESLSKEEKELLFNASNKS
jgi:membrane associated rhomboid family serine protease